MNDFNINLDNVKFKRPFQFDPIPDTEDQYEEVTDISEFMKGIAEQEIIAMSYFTELKDKITSCFEGTGVLEKEKGKFEMLPNELMIVYLTKSLCEEVVDGKQDISIVNKVGRKLNDLQELK